MTELKCGQIWKYEKDNESIIIKIHTIFGDTSIWGIIINQNLQNSNRIIGKKYSYEEHINESSNWSLIQDSLGGMYCKNCDLVHNNAIANYYDCFVCWKCKINDRY